jgi:hypothetical protein
LRRSLIAVAAVIILNTSLMQAASAATICAWIVETAEPDGLHKFALNMSADAATSVSVKFQGPNFTSGAMGGDMIDLAPNEAREVDGEGFDVSPGDALSFTVKVFDRPIATLSEEPGPARAAFVFQRKAPDGEQSPPPDLAAKQCKAVG